MFCYQSTYWLHLSIFTSSYTIRKNSPSNSIFIFMLTYFLSRFHKKFTHGSLSRSYQLNENTRTLHVVLPLSVAHSLIFIFFLVFAMFVRIYLKPIMDMINFVTIVEASNIVRIFLEQSESNLSIYESKKFSLSLLDCDYLCNFNASNVFSFKNQIFWNESHHAS